MSLSAYLLFPPTTPLYRAYVLKSLGTDDLQHRWLLAPCSKPSFLGLFIPRNLLTMSGSYTYPELSTIMMLVESYTSPNHTMGVTKARPSRRFYIPTDHQSLLSPSQPI